MKIYSILVIALFMIGCSNKVVTVEKIVTVPKNVYIPVKCKIPKIVCTFGNGDESTSRKMLECIVTQKRVIEACGE